MQRRTLIIASTKVLATVLGTEIMLLPGCPTASWLVRAGQAASCCLCLATPISWSTAGTCCPFFSKAPMHICMQGFLSAVGVLSKVCMLLFTACFMQIPFQEHLLVQGIQVGPLLDRTSRCPRPACSFLVLIVPVIQQKKGSQKASADSTQSCTAGVPCFQWHACLRVQVGYCIAHNGRMCAALETRYLGIRERCGRLARALSLLSYEAQAPLKARSRLLSEARACESVNAYLQV